jgi:hypothetical protein
MYEDQLASEITAKFLQRTTPSTIDQSLEYLAITSSCMVPISHVRDKQHKVVPLNSAPTKKVLSLKPSAMHKSVRQSKGEIMKRYEGAGYYFLEAYIDRMMLSGTCSIVDW